MGLTEGGAFKKEILADFPDAFSATRPSEVTRVFIDFFGRLHPMAAGKRSLPEVMNAAEFFLANLASRYASQVHVVLMLETEGRTPRSKEPEQRAREIKPYDDARCADLQAMMPALLACPVTFSAEVEKYPAGDAEFMERFLNTRGLKSRLFRACLDAIVDTDPLPVLSLHVVGASAASWPAPLVGETAVVQGLEAAAARAAPLLPPEGEGKAVPCILRYAQRGETVVVEGCDTDLLVYLLLAGAEFAAAGVTVWWDGTYANKNGPVFQYFNMSAVYAGMVAKHGAQMTAARVARYVLMGGDYLLRPARCGIQAFQEAFPADASLAATLRLAPGPRVAVDQAEVARRIGGMKKRKSMLQHEEAVVYARQLQWTLDYFCARTLEDVPDPLAAENNESKHGWTLMETNVVASAKRVCRN